MRLQELNRAFLERLRANLFDALALGVQPTLFDRVYAVANHTTKLSGFGLGFGQRQAGQFGGFFVGRPDLAVVGSKANVATLFAKLVA
ncbi:MAG: hypothetical protein R3E04_11605 [Sphingobium sp.]